MAFINESNNLSFEELQELIPQLQDITDKYKRAESMQKALFDISELSSSVNELSKLYPAIHNIVGNLMDARNLFVAFYDSSTQRAEFVYFVDEKEDIVLSEISSDDLMNGITGHILRNGQHIFLSKESYHQQLEELGLKGIGPDAIDWIGVPLKRGSQIIGAMVVQSYDDSIRYTPQDLELLLFVSQHIVNCVDRVKNRELTETTIRERTKQLRTINEELQEEILERQKVESLQQALFDISELSSQVEGEMDDFYTSIHTILNRLINAPNCYIALINELTKRLEFPYFSDERASGVEPRPLGLGLTEYVIRNGRAELIDSKRVKELADTGELDKHLFDSMQQSNTSWLGSPLIVDGEISGVIAIQSYSTSVRYSLKDLEFLRFVSNHIAVALGRKYAADSLQAYNQQLTEKVKERTEELNKANAFLHKQIEERNAIQQKLEHDAQHDALTNLANRVLFNSRVEHALASKLRHASQNYAVIFIDLDRFKQINDTQGHHAGDHFLMEVSSRIASCIRAHDLLARLGGDEFVVLVDNFKDAIDVHDIAARIIESIAAPFLLDKKEVFSGASIGIAFMENTYVSADEIIRDADAAMYQAKAQGRGCYVVFDSTMREQLLEELKIEDEFRQRLKDGSFDCYSQPIFDLSSKEVLYEECYIRLQPRDLTDVRREQYRQVAEQSGLIVDIDAYMLGKACEILSAWGKGEASYRERKLAINLSIQALTQSNLAEQLIKTLLDAKVKPKLLVIEFDENDLNKRSQVLLPAINILKDAGITLVLDNFGSGLASLNYLYSYPFDYIKIDHRFVKTLPRSTRNLKLVQSVMSISSHLNFKLIAEGVQNEKQLEMLTDTGCMYAQGQFLQAASALDKSK